LFELSSLVIFQIVLKTILQQLKILYRDNFFSKDLPIFIPTFVTVDK
jgi:hypothetical protein